MSPIRLATIITATAAGMLLAGATAVVLAPLCLGRDVAAMFVALQLPWVLMAMESIHRRHGRIACFVMGSGMLLAWGFGVQFLASVDRAWFAPLPGAMIRAALAGGLVLSCALVGWPNHRRIVAGHFSRSAPLAAGLSLFIAVVPPALFLHSRFDAEFRRVRDLLEQSRFTAAVRTLDRLAWYPTTDRLFDIDRRTLLAQARSAEQEVRQAWQRFERQSDSASTSLERARLLAMLAQEEAALEVMSGLVTPTAEAWNLRGTILETQDQWAAAGKAYRAARESGSLDRAVLAQALRGIAYCERKQGHERAAEAALLELLDLEPTAETHFLLGQFYENAQQPESAWRHLRQAAAIDPAHFQTPTESLQRQLRRQHFGCLPAYWSGPPASSRNDSR
jgi:hypothetical protein